MRESRHIEFLHALVENILFLDTGKTKTINEMAATIFYFRTFIERAFRLICENNNISARSMSTVCDWIVQNGYISDKSISMCVRVYKSLSLDDMQNYEDIQKYSESIEHLPLPIFNSIIKACEES